MVSYHVDIDQIHIVGLILTKLYVLSNLFCTLCITAEIHVYSDRQWIKINPFIKYVQRDCIVVPLFYSVLLVRGSFTLTVL